MKKGYYIHFEGRQSVGVSKKMDMQIEEFGKHFSIEEIDVKCRPRNLLQRVLGLFPTASISREYDEALNTIDEPDFIYARRSVCDRAYLGFWKQIRQKYPQCRIIIEIFTYPYDKDDFGKWNAWPFLIKEWIYRPKLKKYIDRFVTYSSHKEIFGIPTIVTTNGIIVDKVRKLGGDTKTGLIRLIGVAYFQRQHGYERVIEGLAEYYKNDDTPYKITLDLVGEGPEKPFYQELVRQYDLEKYVKFHPMTVGEALDDLYDNADIALAVFGAYKMNYHESTGAIKTRECFAKGIPLISGSPLTGVNDDYPYTEIFDNCAGPIDMKRVTELYGRACLDSGSRSDTADSMRNYAKEHMSMGTVMSEIIDFVKGQNARG